MKAPSSTLVVDASVLIAMVRGRSSYALVEAAKDHRLLVTDTTVSETQRRLELGMKRPELTPLLFAAVELMNFIPARQLDTAGAALVLRDAVANRNGSAMDAPILACAWAFDADIWSFDRDFAGTGVASWSTANLMRALDLKPAAI